MKMRYLPLALAIWPLLGSLSSTAAQPKVLRSPKIAETYSDNSVLWQQLRWLPESHQLVATLTLSNVNYVSDIEPRHDETFDFPLPGVDFDAGTGTFYLRGPHGRSMPIAVVRHALLVKSIELLPGSRINVSNHGGQVAVELLAN
jgi:hypothetical protein